MTTFGGHTIPALLGDAGAALPIAFFAPWTGANGATAYIEESANAAVATFLGATQISTAQFVSPPSSVTSSGAFGARVTFPSIAAYDVADKDFSIKTRIRFSVVTPGYAVSIWGAFAVRSYEFGWESVGGGRLRFSYAFNPAGQFSVDALFSPIVNTWYLFEARRTGTVIQLFVNDLQVGADHNIGATVIRAPTLPLTIMDSGNGARRLNGFLDDTIISIAA